jgi:hypothetical protein
MDKYIDLTQAHIMPVDLMHSGHVSINASSTEIILSQSIIEDAGHCKTSWYFIFSTGVINRSFINFPLNVEVLLLPGLQGGSRHNLFEAAPHSNPLSQLRIHGCLAKSGAVSTRTDMKASLAANSMSASSSPGISSVVGLGCQSV